ncbi:hypothetical protein SK128_020912, partial [Halocaridina rubra]
GLTWTSVLRCIFSVLARSQKFKWYIHVLIFVVVLLSNPTSKAVAFKAPVWSRESLRCGFGSEDSAS